MQIKLKKIRIESIFSDIILNISIIHHPDRYNQNIIPSSNSYNSLTNNA